MQKQPFHISIKTKKRGPKTILALHGLQSNQQMYEVLLSDSSFEAFTVITLDFLGFGESDKPEAFSYDLSEQAQNVAQILETELSDEVIVLGHSLGGMVGTLLLERIPQRISKLISLEGNLTLKDCGESLRVSEMTFQRFRDYYESWREELGRENGVSGQKRAEWMASTPPHAFYRSAQSIVEWARSEKLMKIFNASSHPKLLLIGEKSSYHSRPSSPPVTIRTIADAGHFLMQENPHATIAAIKEFVHA